MKSSLKKQAERFLREQKDYKRWLAVFLCLAVVVTIGTTAALKYRGIAVTSDDSATDAMHMEQTEGNTEEIPEGMRKHVHTADCYEMQPVLICGMTAPGDETADGVTADAGAGDAANAGAADTTQGHVHTDACYQVTGGTEILTCTTPEHTHGADCYATKTVRSEDEEGNVTEETVETLTCTTQEHTHGADCYIVEDGERTLTCTIPEGAEAAPATVAEAAPAAADATAPVSAESTAPAPETEGAAAPAGNTDTENTGATGETVSGHVHTDACYEMQSVLICGKEEGELEEDVSGNDILSDEMNLVQTAETENYSVTVTYSESARIPKEAVLQVVEYAKDSDAYHECCEELDYQPGGLLDIGFFADGEEFQPKKPVIVKIVDKMSEDAAAYEIAHFAKSGTERIDSDGVKTADGIETEFLVDSFSLVTVTNMYGEEQGTDIQAIAPISGIAHEKYIEPVAGMDDVYDLTLNVKGAVGSTEEKAELNIVFVVDTSGSMEYAVDRHNYNGTSRQKAVRTAITNLVNDLESDSGIDAKYKLVTFANMANSNNASYWMNGSDLITKLPRNSNGGTNYEDAMLKAQEAVATKNSNAKSVIVFLTDGAPTYYNNGRGGYAGQGSDTTEKEIGKAIEGAGKIGAECDYFFAVGFGSDMTSKDNVGSSRHTAYEILKEMAEATYPGKNAAEGKMAMATTTIDLASFFEDFKASIKKIQAVNVSFTDKLTSSVILMNQDGTTPAQTIEAGKAAWVCKITDENGNEVTNASAGIEGYPGTTVLQESGMTVYYNEEVDGLKVDFADDYKLRDGYTYSVTARIKTNLEATEPAFRANGYSYPDEGEPETGLTSEGKGGFFSNEKDSAKVNYSYIVGDGSPIKHDALDYPRPVVQMKNEPKRAPETIQKMGHNKYVEVANVAGRENEDLYNLTLDITGQVADETTQTAAKYDIMFVVDTSGSMEYSEGNTTRMKAAQNAMSNLIDDLGKRGIDAHYNVVSFASEAQNATEWMEGPATKTYIKNNLDPDGGTNYQDGFVKAAQGMSGARDDAIKVVIFLTDGQPTFHLASGGHSEWVKCNHGTNIFGGCKEFICYRKYLLFGERGRYVITSGIVSNDGNSTEGGGNKTVKDDFDGALMGAGALEGKADYFYAIGFGSGMTSSSPVYTDENGTSYTAKKLLEAVHAATNIPGGEVTTTTDLSGYFKDMIESIIQFNCYDVTITDELSQWAEIDASSEAPGKPAMLKVELIDNTKKDERKVLGFNDKMDANGNVAMSLPKSSTNPKGGTMTASYVTGADGKRQVKLDFSDEYKLEAGYTYAVTIRIKPTKAAYEERINGAGYPHTGDPGTDAPGANEQISSEKAGFFSNNWARADYTYDDKPDHVDYNYPVIQTSTAEIKITKEIAGLDGLDEEKKNEYLSRLTFAVDGKNEVSVKEKDTDENGNVTYKNIFTENQDGTYSYTKEVAIGEHKVSELWQGADIENYTRKTTVTVAGKDQQLNVEERKDITVTANAAEKNKAVEVKFTNSYTLNTQEVNLLKVDGSGNVNDDLIGNGITFDIRKADSMVNDAPDDTKDEGIKEYQSVLEEMKKAEKESDKKKILDTYIGKQELVYTLEVKEASDEKDKGKATVIEVGASGDNDINKMDFTLPVGRYVVTEKSPLNNYLPIIPFIIDVRDEDVEIGTIPGFVQDKIITPEKQANGTFQIKVRNTKVMLPQMQIVKVASAPGNGQYTILPGAVFELVEKVQVNGETVEKDVKLTDENNNPINTDNLELKNGQLEKALKNLPHGTYTLKEIKAPAGYNLPTDGFDFTITGGKDSSGNSTTVLDPVDKTTMFLGKLVEVEEEKDGKKIKVLKCVATTGNSYDDNNEELWILAITNDTGAELPVTGGPGTAAYTFGGLAMIIAVSLMYGLNMRRKRGKGGLK